MKSKNATTDTHAAEYIFFNAKRVTRLDVSGGAVHFSRCRAARAAEAEGRPEVLATLRLFCATCNFSRSNPYLFTRTRMIDFEALYKHHARDIYRFALYLCGNHAEAEDITSETFVRAWNASGEIRAVTAKSYLFAIARNGYLEGLRRRARHTELDENLADSSANPHADAERRIELNRVLGALQQLPEMDRTVMLLRVQGEWSYQEIADAVGLSLPAVKVKIHRARLRLAQWRAEQEISKF